MLYHIISFHNMTLLVIHDNTCICSPKRDNACNNSITRVSFSVGTNWFSRGNVVFVSPVCSVNVLWCQGITLNLFVLCPVVSMCMMCH